MQNTYSNLGQYYKDIQTAGNPNMATVPMPKVQEPTMKQTTVPMPPVRKKTNPAIGLLLQQLLQSMQRRRLPSTPQVPQVNTQPVSRPTTSMGQTGGFGRLNNAQQAREAMRRSIMAQIQANQ